MAYRRLLCRCQRRPQLSFSPWCATQKGFVRTEQQSSTSSNRVLASSPSFHSSGFGDFDSQTGDFQRTVSRAVSRSGVGLHTGATACLKLMPAAAGEGRYFVHLSKGAQRQDEEVRVPSSLRFVVETTLSTCVGLGQTRVRTVEHLLSALEGLGVDNCRIEIEGGNEVPLLDGSAKVWVEAVHEAGLSFAMDKGGNQVLRDTFVLKQPLFVSKEDSFVAAFPSSDLRITYGIDFQEVPAIRTQWFSICLGDASNYEVEIAPARTFGIAEQVSGYPSKSMLCIKIVEQSKYIQELFTLILSFVKDGWLNLPLRFSDEPCRHKLLDLIGDLALCAQNGNPGLPVAHIIAFKAGHLLHTEFGGALLHAMRDQAKVSGRRYTAPQSVCGY